MPAGKKESGRKRSAQTEVNPPRERIKAAKTQPGDPVRKSKGAQSKNATAAKAGNNKRKAAPKKAAKKPAKAAKKGSAESKAPGSKLFGKEHVLNKPEGGHDFIEITPWTKSEKPKGQDIIWPRGEEPWRKLGIHVSEDIGAVLTAEAVKKVNITQKIYWATERQAVITELARLKKSKGAGKNGQAIGSMRPDRVAASLMRRRRLCCNVLHRFGHIPGIYVGSRFSAREEISVLGCHFIPVGGIDFTTFPTRTGLPTVATSIVVSGCYEDDDDNGKILIYTGQGGNDGLGNKKQYADQELKLGNLALLGNIALGIPVRAYRKNVDKEALYGSQIIYDGLYDVVLCLYSRGKSGFMVYRYKMIRREGQGELISQRVRFGMIAGSRKVVSMVGVIDKDISGGLEKLKIPTVNNVDKNLSLKCFPAIFDIARMPRQDEIKGGYAIANDLRPLAKKFNSRVEYISRCLPVGFDPAVVQREMPPGFEGRAHDLVWLLNGGRLPYATRDGVVEGSVVTEAKRTGFKRGVFQPRLVRTQAMVYECGPKCECKWGEDCIQSVTQQGLKYRIQVRKTENKGYGACSEDNILENCFVGEYVGEVHKPDGNNIGGHGIEYSFDACSRTDYTLEHKQLPSKMPKGGWRNSGLQSVHTEQTKNDPDRLPLYIVDAAKKGNWTRFINHSCDPNLFIQPVVTLPGSDDLPRICFFSLRNIPAYQDFSINYGEDFIKTQMKGKCLCGSPLCKFP